MHLGHGQFVHRLRTRGLSKNDVTNSSHGEGSDISLTAAQHENGDLRKIKVCVNLRKVGHPTLRKLSAVRKGL